MQIGFVSAIVPEFSLEQVLQFASDISADCVELMCWPTGKAERRYAGVTHLDVAALDDSEADRVCELVASSGVTISGLGYYPNPLAADPAEAQLAQEHLRNVIRAAPQLELTQVNTFIGRDPRLSVDENWPRFLEVWRPLIKFAEDHGVRIGIENCPMLFTRDEWPGGKNLATTPAIWQRMFADIPSDNFGLNFDPSHCVWQLLDYQACLRDFRDKLFHIHAKDARLDREKLQQVGTLAYPNQYHTPKLPGLGEVNWGMFFSTLGDTGYTGPVCVEVEDRAYEKSLATRKQAVAQSVAYLRNFAGFETE